MTIKPGILLEHAYYTPVELDTATIALAFDLGWQDAAAAELLDAWQVRPSLWDVPPRLGHPVWDTYPSWRDALRDATNSAIEYLQSLSPDGYGVWHDGEVGALVCAVIDEPNTTWE